jgi:hypothetical protein
MSEIIQAVGPYNAAVIQALDNLGQQLADARLEQRSELKGIQDEQRADVRAIRESIEALVQQTRLTQRIASDNAQRQIEFETRIDSRVKALEAGHSAPMLPPLYWIAGGVCATAFVLTIGFIGLFVILMRAIEFLT